MAESRADDDVDDELETARSEPAHDPGIMLLLVWLVAILLVLIAIILISDHRPPAGL
jgi:hypothetical protein